MSYKRIAEKLCSISSDKYVHLLCCMLITWVIAKGVMGVGCPTFLASLLGATIAFYAGFYKEYLDNRQEGNHFDKKDLWADGAGCLLGFLFTLI